MIFTNRRQKLNRQSSIGGLSVLLLSALVFVITATTAEAQSAINTMWATPGDTRVQLGWPNPFADNRYHYRYREGSGSWTDWAEILPYVDGRTTYVLEGLTNESTYTFSVRAVNFHNQNRVQTVNVPTATATPRAAPEQPTGVTATATDEGEVTLTWTDPSDTNINDYQIRYRRSGDDETFDDDDERDWTPINPSSDGTTITYRVTGLFGVAYIFELRARDTELISQDQASAAASLTLTPTGDPPPVPPVPPPPLSPLSPAPVAPPAPPPGTVLVLDCPIAWQARNAAGDPTPRVFIRTVEVDIANNPLVGVYKATAIEIYADPTDPRTDLDGWTLRVKGPYDVVGIDYPLTPENSVFDAQGVLRIESTQATPFPTTDLRISNGPLPGFDYRLFDEKNQPVDLALACYRGLNTFAQLGVMGAPRVERNVDLTDVMWEDVVFLRSEWRVPAAAPAAPSLPRRLTTLWGSLKKQ